VTDYADNFMQASFVPAARGFGSWRDVCELSMVKVTGPSEGAPPLVDERQ
jgi:hypothetical protein